ncbi:Uncharacterised protein [Mycobacterium tuberculosis]|nr:Uncharacterised protein [Mycobacterium tuberculosis]
MIDPQKGPQLGDAESATGLCRNIAQSHPVRQHTPNRDFQHILRRFGSGHTEPVAEVVGVIVDVGERYLSQQQRQDETDHRDRDRAKEHLGERLGICPHDRGGHALGQLMQDSRRWHCRDRHGARRQRGTESSVQEVYEQRTECCGTKRGADHPEEGHTRCCDAEVFERRRVLHDENEHLHGQSDAGT